MRGERGGSNLVPPKKEGRIRKKLSAEGRNSGNRAYANEKVMMMNNKNNCWPIDDVDWS